MTHFDAPNPPVSLHDVVDALDMTSDEIRMALERETGRIVMIMDPMLVGEDAVDVTMEDVDGPEWALLPDRFEIHEWAIMRSFCDEVEDEAVRERLLRAVHGRGAFRRFKDVVFEEDLPDAWFAYRYARLEDLARGWLEAEGIAYVDEGGDDEEGATIKSLP